MRRLSSLARLRGARLAYPSNTPTIPLDLDIPPATQGGHALLGCLLRLRTPAAHPPPPRAPHLGREKGE